MIDPTASLPGRRRVLGGLAALSVTSTARAQMQPVSLGAILALTGSGGVYGQPMAKVARAVVDEVNAAGGIKGRPIAFTVEDDRSSPDVDVRAARKLIDIDKVVAIVGTWTSAGVMAVAPLCWESQTFLATIAGADAVTQLPHQGYLVRTQPNTTLQGRKFGEYAVEKGAKRVQFVSPQTPFAQSQFDNIAVAVRASGGTATTLIYDGKKPSYRSEVDEVMRGTPDTIIFGGYTPDTIVMLKEVYRAGFKGLRIAFGYSVNDSLLAGLPADVSDGIVTISPSPAEGSAAYERVVRMSGMSRPDPYTSQVYDHVNLVVLALAAAGQAELNGTAVKQFIRTVSQGPGGAKIDNAIDGMRLLAGGQAIDYEGASGPCDFTDSGDILSAKFRYDQVKDGKLSLIRIA